MHSPDQEFYRLDLIDVWRNKSSSGALQVLTDSNFVQLRLAEYYENIAQKFGRDFINIRQVSKYIPLFHDGENHKYIRKLAAIHLRHVAQDLKDFEDESVALITSTLRKEGAHELVSEIVIPVMQNISYALTKLDYYPGLIAILSGNNSLKATMKIDKTFGNIYALAKERFPNEDEEKRSIRVVFASLGSEPLGATLARSFDILFQGKKCADIASLGWSSNFPATGPGMAYRECKHAPINLGGTASAVKVVDVNLHTFLTDEGANPNHVFGVGAHACIGRGISLSLWARVVADMKDSPFKITHIHTAPTTHKIFDYPSAIQIEVSK